MGSILDAIREHKLEMGVITVVSVIGTILLIWADKSGYADQVINWLLGTR